MLGDKKTLFENVVCVMIKPTVKEYYLYSLIKRIMIYYFFK